jgi:hypothetical protein
MKRLGRYHNSSADHNKDSQKSTPQYLNESTPAITIAYFYEACISDK